jgi:hypothetical protein
VIEVNLIPDVKYELLKARSLRVKIISICTVTTIIAGGTVALLCIYVFGVQTVAGVLADNGTNDEYQKLSKVQDLSKMLTIQDQLGQISTLEAEKTQSSRIFDMLETIIPSGENTVSYSSLKLDTDEDVITIDAEAKNGYEALEVFKKTINQTKFIYPGDDGKSKEISIIAAPIVEGERSYGRNSSDQRVLRFTLSFKYAPELLSTTIKNGVIQAPEKQNATDSARGVPKSLFSEKAKED